jgi:succinate dehydrogenase hydrophobic membrane anchor protein
MKNFYNDRASGEGLKRWWFRKRVIMALIPLWGLMAFTFVKAATSDYDALVAFIAHPVVTTGLILFVVLFFYHAFYEIRGCIEDYLTPPWFVRAFIVVVNFAAIFLALLGVVSILKISLGGV